MTSSIDRNTLFDATIEKSHIHEVIILIFETFERIHDKVEKILKGSLDLIPSPSPSVKIQIMGEKVSLKL